MDLREDPKTLALINKGLEDKPTEFREYFGISGAGDPCNRKPWLDFRWASTEQLSGRVIRLLNRGHREEAYVVKLLRSAGVTVTETGTKQREVKLGPWLKGHCDGIITTGLVESPNNPHILEVKTANLKSFKEMQEKGLKVAKPIYYAQVQLYMLSTGIERAFFWMVCKDDDSVYTERVHLDKEFAEGLRALCNDLALSQSMPPANGNQFLPTCKYCKHYQICFAKAEPNRNCRTCEYGRFGDDGYFRCLKKAKKCHKAQQLKGCKNYKLMSAFERAPWEN